VVQQRQRARLAIEAREAFGILCHRCGQHFERHLPTESDVGRPVHLAHAARAQSGEDFVDTETAAGSQRHQWRLQERVEQRPPDAEPDF
jgi:hypothetical protein